MYLIVVYDISDVNLQNKIRNYMRRFLYHTQFSVFEGDVTPSQFKEIELYMKNLKLESENSVIIYKLRDQSKVMKHVFGKPFDENKNII